VKNDYACIIPFAYQIFTRKDFPDYQAFYRRDTIPAVIKRLWIVLSVLWAVFILWGMSTKPDGLGKGDVILAVLPVVVGLLLWLAARFILGTRRPGSRPFERFRG
jgi:hypothetical protein